MDIARLSKRLAVAYFVAVLVVVIIALVKEVVNHTRFDDQKGSAEVYTASDRVESHVLLAPTGAYSAYYGIVRSNVTQLSAAVALLSEASAFLEDFIHLPGLDQSSELYQELEESREFLVVETTSLVTYLNATGVLGNASYVAESAQTLSLLANSYTNASIELEEIFEQANGKVLHRFQLTQYILFAVMIAVILTEIACIFRPTARMINHAFQTNLDQLQHMKILQAKTNQQLAEAQGNLEDAVLQKYFALVNMMPYFENAVSKAKIYLHEYLKIHFYDPQARKAWEHLSILISRRTEELAAVRESLAENPRYKAELAKFEKIIEDHTERHIPMLKITGVTKEWLNEKWSKAAAKYRQKHRIRLHNLISTTLEAAAAHGFVCLFFRFLIFEVSREDSLEFLYNWDSSNSQTHERSQEPEGSTTGKSRIATDVLTQYKQYIETSESNQINHIRFLNEFFALSQNKEGKKDGKICKELYEKYVFGDRQITIDAKIQSDLNSRYSEDNESLRLYMFQKVKTQVIQLLAQSSYKKFLRTKQLSKVYKDCAKEDKKISSILQDLNEFSEKLLEFVAHHCEGAVKAGHFDLAQSLWKSGMELFDDVAPICLLDAQTFLASCHYEISRNQELWAQQNWQSAGKKKDRLVSTMSRTKRNWVAEILHVMQPHIGSVKQVLQISVLPALLRADAVRKVEKLMKAQLYGMDKYATETDSKDTAEDAEVSASGKSKEKRPYNLSRVAQDDDNYDDKGDEDVRSAISLETDFPSTTEAERGSKSVMPSRGDFRFSDPIGEEKYPINSSPSLNPADVKVEMPNDDDEPLESSKGRLLKEPRDHKYSSQDNDIELQTLTSSTRTKSPTKLRGGQEGAVTGVLPSPIITTTPHDERYGFLKADDEASLLHSLDMASKNSQDEDSVPLITQERKFVFPGEFTPGLAQSVTDKDIAAFEELAQQVQTLYKQVSTLTQENSKLQQERITLGSLLKAQGRCANCGYKSAGSGKYCHECGASLLESPDAAPEQKNRLKDVAKGNQEYKQQKVQELKKNERPMKKYDEKEALAALELIRQSWSTATGTGTEKEVLLTNVFVTIFYTRLEEICPESKRMFHASVERRTKALSGVYSSMTLMLQNPKDCEKRMTGLAPLHQRMGVTENMFNMYREALVDTLKERIGGSWNDAIEDAWWNSFTLLASLLYEKQKHLKLAKVTQAPGWLVEDLKKNQDEAAKCRDYAKAHLETFSVIFYRILAEECPETKAIFVTVERQQKALVGAMDNLVAMIEHPELLHKQIANLVALHSRLGVTREMFDAYGVALRKAFDQTMGEMYTDEQDAIWKRFYSILSEHISTAVEEIEKQIRGAQDREACVLM